MKIGVFNPIVQDKPFDEACAYLAAKGVQMIEIGCGGYPGKAHCDPEVLLHDDRALEEFKDVLKRNHLEISALSAHGNMLHPNKEIAAKFDNDLTNAILLAEKLGVPIVNTFSGCPGDCEASQRPNWVTCSWPEDFAEILEWQWNEKLIPYWKDKVAFAKAHNVHKIALELHPGFCVYNTKSLLRLREAVGPEIGANFDPSHLIWQQMDPVLCIRELGKAGAIFHFHAKDTKIDPYNVKLNGVLDTTHYGDLLHRSWTFRSLGYGNDAAYWKAIMSELRLAGYDYAISIEHEDPLMSPNEGLTKTIEVLKEALMFEELGEIYWA